MSVEMQEMIHFHLTGKRGDTHSGEPSIQQAFPALLVPYRDLSKLRYDYPLVLLEDADTKVFVDTLTGIINRLLRDIAPEGNAGARLRQHVLRLEMRMRELVTGGLETSLFELWEKAEKSLLAECKKPEADVLKNSLTTARFALRTNGQVIDCDDSLPSRLLQHAWERVETHRTRKSREHISSLIIGLRNILKVDDLKAEQSRTPQRLKQTLGRRYQEAFDFELMSQILNDAAPHNELPAERRSRIQAALSVLESQRFFPDAGRAKDTEQGKQYSFVFRSASNALLAYNDRLQEIAEIIKAIAIAELECENMYRDDKHAAYFDRFGMQALAPADLALFPSYLICLQESRCDAQKKAMLAEIASSDLPMKILLQVSEALGEPSPVDRQPHYGAFVQQMANTFVALGNAYVLQSASSNLYEQRDNVRNGLEFRGPAFFSIFAGSSDLKGGVPQFLQAAAAMESRVFPVFRYDPAAGVDLADRFSIGGNPEVEAAWPRREFRYEDDGLQVISEEYAFTLVDFAIVDPQYSDYFAPVPKESWNDDMLPVSDYLELEDDNLVDKVPYVPVVDGDNVLRRLIVDDNLIRIARRCRDRWHALQEQGGVNNSHASALLARERAAWEEEKEKQIQAIRSELAAAEPSPTAKPMTVFSLAPSLR